MEDTINNKMKSVFLERLFQRLSEEQFWDSLNALQCLISLMWEED